MLLIVKGIGTGSGAAVHDPALKDLYKFISSIIDALKQFVVEKFIIYLGHFKFIIFILEFYPLRIVKLVFILIIIQST
jgi:hypothetical protein